MGDVEDMIGELEDEEDTEAEDAEEPGTEDETEETFGLDLDSAWSSPDRAEEE